MVGAWDFDRFVCSPDSPPLSLVHVRSCSRSFSRMEPHMGSFEYYPKLLSSFNDKWVLELSDPINLLFLLLE
jgi:hypothetical protein